MRKRRVGLFSIILTLLALASATGLSAQCTNPAPVQVPTGTFAR